MKNVKISNKLLLSFALMIAVVATVGLMGYLGAKHVHDNLIKISEINLPGLSYLLEADRDLHQLLVAERSMIFSDAQSEYFKELVGQYEENLEQAWTRWTKFKELAQTEDEKELIPAFEEAFEKCKAVSAQIFDGRNQDSRSFC